MPLLCVIMFSMNVAYNALLHDSVVLTGFLGPFQKIGLEETEVQKHISTQCPLFASSLKG